MLGTVQRKFYVPKRHLFSRKDRCSLNKNKVSYSKRNIVLWSISPKKSVPGLAVSECVLERMAELKSDEYIEVSKGRE